MLLFSLFHNDYTAYAVYTVNVFYHTYDTTVTIHTFVRLNG